MIFAVLLSAVVVSGIHAQTTAYYTMGPSTGGGGTGSGTATGSSSGTTTASPPPPAGCKPRAPAGYAWNGEAQNGIWYQYMYGPPNFPLKNLLNSIELDTGLGWLYDQDGTYAQASITSGRKDDPPYDCWSAYIIQNTSCNGFCYGKTRIGGLGGSNTDITFHTFYKMYLEPNFFYLRGYCFPPADTLTVEYCTNPGISVWTRKMPKDITPLEDRVIRDAIDDRMQMYCLSSADMVYNVWKYDLPTCPNVEKPAAFTEESRYYQENMVKKCKSSDMPYSCTAASFY